MLRARSFPRPTLMIVTCCAITGLMIAPAVHAQEGSPSLFDGQSLTGWTTQDGEPVTRGWEIVDGTIHLAPSDERAGNIVTAREVGNFVLSFEFKIAPGGNSGLKYRVKDFDGSILGCEYQVYDDANPNHPVKPKNSTGSLYDVYEPSTDRLLHPAGEFNTAKIVVVDNIIEHWLNGRRVVRAVVGSPEWDRRIAASKFKDDAGFGENRFGKLMLTDHGSEVWYRNFDFTELPTEPAGPLLASSDAACCCSSSPCCQATCPPRRCARRFNSLGRCCRFRR